MIGRVVSNKMTKTAVVLIESRKTHPLYKKSYAWTKKYLVDDALGVKIGDVVEIIETRPISKRKHWKITKVVGADFEAVATEHLKEGVKEAIEEVMPEEKVEEQTKAETEAVETEVKVEVKEDKKKKASAKAKKEKVTEEKSEPVVKKPRAKKEAK